MSVCVLDVSVAATLLFLDEATPQIDALLTEVSRRGAVVPALWPYEFANLMRTGQRRGRISREHALTVAQRVATLPINVAPAMTIAECAEMYTLAHAHSLTAYDAAYLELAVRLKLPLATRDEDLRRAAAALGLSALPALPA